jgi:class 3 adenylate cyclase/tetratricopeptide (TPR) repeat protein
MAACPACGVENPDGSRFCNACGERFAESAPAQEVRKTVTVVFCDVTGSTALGERLDAEALRRVMMRYFDAMTQAIERHGGTVEKFIGDAVMAVFGIPTTHEDDAIRAVRAADDMREGLRSLNKELERDHGATLECRIGVNTGEVVAGDASTRQALITGDTVNVAARLEQGAAPGEVLIARSTARLVRDAAVLEQVEPLDLKGKAEPVAAHRLVAVHAGAAGTARRMDSPLVGRDRQLGQLRQAFDEVVADRVCHLFTVLGAAGVGKSRLIQEALGQLADAMILRGRCLSYGEGITYWPLLEVVRDALGGGTVDGDLAASLAALIPSDPSADEVASRVAAVVGGGAELTATAEEIGWAVRRLLEGLARERPVIVILDDIHWAEPSFLDLVDQLTDWSREAPILLVCMARPDLLETSPGWGGGKLHATTVALEPLSSDDVEHLVGNFLAGGELDDALRLRIEDAAGGNPLFVEETLAMLVDDGLLRLEGGRWVATGDLDEVAVPPTIQALLAARLDRLDDADRLLLGRASIIGLSFYLGALRELAPEPERGEVSRRVQQLLRRDLIRPDASDVAGEEAFRFHHVLLRDAAYQMLPKETRAGLHERFAGWLDAHPGLTDLDEFVGYHLEQAHALRLELGPEDEHARTIAVRAADRLAAAGKRARDRGDFRASETFFRRAAALRAPDDPMRARDLLALAWSLVGRDHDAEAIPWFDQALAAASASGDRSAENQASLGEVYARTIAEPEGGVRKLASMLDRMTPELEELGDDAGLAIAFLLRANVAWMFCRFSDAKVECDRALGSARAAGDGQWVFTATTMRAVAGLLGSAPVSEVAAILDQVDAEVVTFPSLRPFASAGRGSLLAMLGQADEARRLSDEAMRLATEMRGSINPGMYEARCRIESFAGDHAAAERFAREGYDVLVSLDNVANSSTFAGERARELLRLGRSDEARRWARVCRETTSSDDVVNQHLWRTVDAVIGARDGRREDADRLIREAVAWADRSDNPVERAELCLDEAEIHHLAGRDDQAGAALNHAREIYRRKGATVGESVVQRHAAAMGLPTQT